MTIFHAVGVVIIVVDAVVIVADVVVIVVDVVVDSSNLKRG